jgi:hypothetical protein
MNSPRAGKNVTVAREPAVLVVADPLRRPMIGLVRRPGLQLEGESRLGITEPDRLREAAGQPNSARCWPSVQAGGGIPISRHGPTRDDVRPYPQCAGRWRGHPGSSAGWDSAMNTGATWTFVPSARADYPLRDPYVTQRLASRSRSPKRGTRVLARGSETPTWAGCPRSFGIHPIGSVRHHLCTSWSPSARATLFTQGLREDHVIAPIKAG